MADLNVWSGTGRLTRDPELRTTQGGTSVCNFRLAVNGFKDDDTVFLDVTVWGKSGEACAQYLHKGARVAASGTLKVREFERRDGTNGTAVEVVARDVAFLQTDQNGGGNGGGQRQAAPAQQPPDDDIPF